MSPTLFWYVFKDLLRIFFLASGALAGIMSFGGLLRPVYEHGLDAGQVAKLLSYFMPAMTTYSLPIAALFATTMVYGRLSADNEVTAARAAGISHLALAVPALVMGAIIALLSLLLLCFIVPTFWLRIERVIYSNIAELVANQIQRTHQIRFEHAATPITVYAQDARVRPPPPDRPNDQIVQLIAPMIVMYDTSDRSNPAPPPEEFYTAVSATAVIREAEDDSSVTLYARLENGMRFPRRPGASQRPSVQVSIGSTNFGPIALPSPVRENTKFLDIFRLRQLLERPELSRRVRSTLFEFILAEQQAEYLEDLRKELAAGPLATVAFDAGDELYLLRGSGSRGEIRRGRLVLTAHKGGDSLRLVQFDERRRPVREVEAREIRIRCFPDRNDDRLHIDLEMIDCVISDAGETTQRPTFPRQFSIEIPAALKTLESRTPQYYLSQGDYWPVQQQRLRRDMLRLSNGVISELNARASFGVSCFILVAVGCALGMMFRSGNFLSAFAVSVIPALLTIALVVAGQQTCGNVPWNISEHWQNPLHLGLLIIWSGNLAVLAISVVLLWRLQRQ